MEKNPLKSFPSHFDRSLGGEGQKEGAVRLMMLYNRTSLGVLRLRILKLSSMRCGITRRGVDLAFYLPSRSAANRDDLETATSAFSSKSFPAR